MSLLASLVKRVKALFKRGGLASDPKTSTELRNAVATQGNADAAELSRRLAAKEVTLKTFQAELFDMTKHAHVSQFALGRGGMDTVTAADRKVLGRLVAEQATYLRDFVAEIGKGGLTEAEIATRAAMYPESAVAAFERGKLAALGVDPPNVPPQHPGCRCSLRSEHDDTGVAIHWELQPGACPVCVEIAAGMAPWRPA